jgi:hypothetical protein
MLADLPAPESYSAIGWVCVIGAALAFGMNQILELVNRARGKAPSPPNAQLESEQREIKRRVKVLEDWKDSLIQKLDADKDEIIRAGEAREKILSSQIRDMGRRIDTVQGDILNLPNEFMALLANARNIMGGKQ